MKTIQITRKFKYNGIDLPDPNSALSVDKVRAMYAMQYPELNNAVVEGPVTNSGVATYTFLRAVGTKGKGDATREMVIAIANGQVGVATPTTDLVKAGKLSAHSRTLLDVALNAKASRPMTLPSSAFGIWG